LHVGPAPTHAAFMVSDFKSLQSLLETFMKARHLKGRKLAGASKIIRTVMRNLVPTFTLQRIQCLPWQT
jgi:hypothetical protein